ncbi:hypothetical protein CRG98_044170 [Punica granatum]|uniref:Uncharacterized protein n=1 Tax=Punica granatum TaxID=22663 RepID=A0A2I0HUQ7_PUNGR|nr:hypothetical protein CRG98_044170 [Punica granatum]
MLEICLGMLVMRSAVESVGVSSPWEVGQPLAHSSSYRGGGQCSLELTLDHISVARRGRVRVPSGVDTGRRVPRLSQRPLGKDDLSWSWCWRPQPRWLCPKRKVLWMMSDLIQWGLGEILVHRRSPMVEAENVLFCDLEVTFLLSQMLEKIGALDDHGLPRGQNLFDSILTIYGRLVIPPSVLEPASHYVFKDHLSTSELPHYS